MRTLTLVVRNDKPIKSNKKPQLSMIVDNGDLSFNRQMKFIKLKKKKSSSTNKPNPFSIFEDHIKVCKGFCDFGTYENDIFIYKIIGFFSILSISLTYSGLVPKSPLMHYFTLAIGIGNFYVFYLFLQAKRSRKCFQARTQDFYKVGA